MKTKIELYNNYHDKPDKRFYSARLVSSSQHARKLSYWVYGITGTILLIMFLPWTQNFKSYGDLTSLSPADRPQTIHSTIAGRIERWYVMEGQHVKKGDTIVYLSEIKDKFFDPDFLVRIKEQIGAKENALLSTKEKSEALNKQISALTDALRYSLSKAKNKVQQSKLKVQSDSIELVAAKTNFDIAKVQFERQEKLYNEGLKSLTDLETRRLKFQEAQAKLLSQENKFFTSKNEMVNAEIELNSLEAEYLDKISKAESELNSTLAYYYDAEGQLSKMNNEYANMQIRNSFYYITAPRDGIIVRALKSGVGETIKEGDDIASIIPDNPHLAAEIFVEPMNVVLLEKGSKVRLQFDGWPVFVFSGWPGVSFGTFGGKVLTIDKIDTKGKYRVLVIPDPTDDPWPKQLRNGTGVIGWALLKDVPVWYELWRQLNGFPPDYIEHTKLGDEQYNQQKNKSKSDKEKEKSDESEKKKSEFE